MNTKKIAAERAVEYVKDHMIVGLGTGSTAYWAIQKLGERVKEGLQIKAIATSVQSEELAKELHIPLIPFAEIESIDVTIDGADEVDRSFHLIKGGGGALLREKIVASASKQLIVIVDETKLVDTLGAFSLPVEIVQFGYEYTLKQLQKLCPTAAPRLAGTAFYVTDNGNFIIDCPFGAIADPVTLHRELNMLPGVVENGLFVHMTRNVIVGYQDGRVEELAIQS